MEKRKLEQALLALRGARCDHKGRNTRVVTMKLFRDLIWISQSLYIAHPRARLQDSKP